MPERNSRRRTPIHGRRSRPPQPTPPPPHRSNHRIRQRSKPIKILHRCSSEPILWTVGSIEEDDRPQNEVLYRPQTCYDVFASPLRSLSPSPCSFQKYRDDSKVVVNVTVEGSPGPVRTMVRLGASVDETIKLVVDRYSEEGRSPRLDPNASSTFELHHSYFSLESLNKTDRIGEAGSRSFFLRKTCSSLSSNRGEEDDGRTGSEIINPSPPIVPPDLFVSFIVRRMKKIGRRTRNFWKVLGCMTCS